MIPFLLLTAIAPADTDAEWFSSPEPVDSAFIITSLMEAPDCLLLRTHATEPPSMRRGTPSGWSLDLTDDYGYGLRMKVDFESDSSEDNLYPSSDAVSLTFSRLPDLTDSLFFRASEGFNLRGGDNLWRLAQSYGVWILTAGCNVPSVSFEIPYPFFPIARISFRPERAGIISLPEIILRQSGRLIYRESIADPINASGEGENDNNPSTDTPRSGLWGILDYNMDSDRAILGGNYTLRLVIPEENGPIYLLYEKGAMKMPGDWKPGDIKGILHPTGIPGIYDFEWTTASGRRLKSGLRAEYESSSEILTLHFPARGATIRLAPLTTPLPGEDPHRAD